MRDISTTAGVLHGRHSTPLESILHQQKRIKMTAEKLKEIGTQMVILRHFRCLAEQFNDLANREDNADGEAGLAFTAASSSLNRVCDEVAEMINTQNIRPAR